MLDSFFLHFFFRSFFYVILFFSVGEGGAEEDGEAKWDSGRIVCYDTRAGNPRLSTGLRFGVTLGEGSGQFHVEYNFVFS